MPDPSVFQFMQRFGRPPASEMELQAFNFQQLPTGTSPAFPGPLFSPAMGSPGGAPMPGPTPLPAGPGPQFSPAMGTAGGAPQPELRSLPGSVGPIQPGGALVPPPGGGTLPTDEFDDFAEDVSMVRLAGGKGFQPVPSIGGAGAARRGGGGGGGPEAALSPLGASGGSGGALMNSAFQFMQLQLAREQAQREAVTSLLSEFLRGGGALGSLLGG